VQTRRRDLRQASLLLLRPGSAPKAPQRSAANCIRSASPHDAAATHKQVTEIGSRRCCQASPAGQFPGPAEATFPTATCDWGPCRQHAGARDSNSCCQWQGRGRFNHSSSCTKGSSRASNAGHCVAHVQAGTAKALARAGAEAASAPAAPGGGHEAAAYGPAVLQAAVTVAFQGLPQPPEAQLQPARCYTLGAA